MDTRNEIRETRERFGEEGGISPAPQEPIGWTKAIGTLVAVLLVTIVAGVLFAGCGSQADSTAQSQDRHAASPGETGGQVQVASVQPATPLRQGGLSASDLAVREGLPPDLSVTFGDTLVVPGQAMEFTVEGTPDVAQVALEDGRDDPTPFVRDSTSNVWRAQYRVPLHPRHERFGVSVTARTQADRWRRVWVFLHVASAADSTEGCVVPARNTESMLASR